ncbi:DUF1772 domain-containing protein [Streptomyces fuscigenes]|uniref:DUF1772 domain-containing protein n=1 Tax=Streptomyces fuscigenes TaxID=1528880 RepID=UPI001F35CB51|nr:DUF1772 domain-containing protein [Streptomyces fuscigenes]MCF3964044.1 DUF1772 domain-containing protein [Streptomyces fuscigenes]
MQDALAVVTVVVVGLMVGVEFAVAVFVNPILHRLPDDGGLHARSDGARVLGRVMPLWYFGSLVLTGIWAALVWGDEGTGPIVSGAALLVLSIVLSILFLVPINSRSAAWSREGAPADWKEQLARWDRLHYVRLAVIVAAFALLAVALAR